MSNRLLDRFPGVAWASFPCRGELHRHQPQQNGLSLATVLGPVELGEKLGLGQALGLVITTGWVPLPAQGEEHFSPVSHGWRAGGLSTNLIPFWHDRPGAKAGSWLTTLSDQSTASSRQVGGAD